MLDIQIKGPAAGGKSRTAHVISEYWAANGKKTHIVEGYVPGKPIDVESLEIDVLIKVIQ